MVAHALMAAASGARTQAERSAATKNVIIAAATRLIAERGFDSTGIEDIVREAGVSKGAMYHHYTDKVEVLAAVYEQIEQHLSARLLAVASKQADPLSALRAGAHEFLDACLDPVVRRIALVEAPAALGWERWRAIDARYGFGLLLTGLRAAADERQVRAENLEERAHLLLASLMEASLMVGASEDPSTARAALGHVVDVLLDALAGTAGHFGPESQA
jgi:AcrR family transcriptional regulator